MLLLTLLMGPGVVSVTLILLPTILTRVEADFTESSHGGCHGLEIFESMGTSTRIDQILTLVKSS